MTTPQKAVCQGVCRVTNERAVFASGAFSVCLSCLTSPAWAAERRRREAAKLEERPAMLHVPLVRG